MREIRRILYIRTDRLGDVLMNLPAIRLLRQSFPKAWLAVMVRESLSEWFREQADIDECIAVSPAKLNSDWPYRLRLWKNLRKAGFDLVIVANSDRRLHQLVFASRIPLRVGWKRKWPFLLNRSVPDKKNSNGRHEVDSNLDLVRLVSSLQWDGRWPVPDDPAARKRIQKRLDESGANSFVALHPGTSNPAKKWPLERFAEIGRRILAEGAHKLVLIGGEEEIGTSQALRESIGQEVLDLTGSLNLRELAALFADSRVKTLVTSDSGPAHVAWIAGKPVIVFFAANIPGSDPSRWGPRSAGSVAFHQAPQEIGAEEVWKALKKVLS